MILAPKPLKQIFGDVDYAWHLLQQEVRLQTSQHITGEDISHLLQLYMRGVQKMNSYLDLRQSYFKNKVTSLMSRPTVIKVLNKPMGKKNQAPLVESSPANKIDNITELQLKEKRKQIQMRIAYGAQEHNPDALNKMLAQQSQKQAILSNKIVKIVDAHEQRLMKRIRQRKLRTMTAKSRSQIYNNNDINDINGIGEMDFKSKIQMMEQRRDQQQFGKSYVYKKQKIPKRKIKSLSPKRSKLFDQDILSPSKRRISMDFRQIKNYNSLNFQLSSQKQ